MYKRILIFLLPFLLGSIAFAQGGKLTGYVKTTTGEPVIGATIRVMPNLMEFDLEELMSGKVKPEAKAGTQSRKDGYYVIINISPGTYNVEVSAIGYDKVTISDVRINSGLTTELDITLNETGIEKKEVVIVAKVPVIQKDRVNSSANLNAEEIKNRPVTSVATLVAQEAGIDGSSIRGGTASETVYMVNGMSMKDERTNTSISNFALTSVQEVQIQTGGFNAEYGDIRSGVVNVVTKEGDKQKYNFAMVARIKPPAKKYQMGPGPADPMSFYLRPYLDPKVCWTGTDSKDENGIPYWSEQLQAQYPSFEGWNKVSEKLLTDNDPTNDLSPLGAQKLFLYQHRKNLGIKNPDMDLDATLSGPVPGGEQLGNLRFMASFIGNKTMLLIPLTTKDYTNYTTQFKLTSDLSSTEKLSFEGVFQRLDGTSASRSGAFDYFATPQGVASAISAVSFGGVGIYTDNYWCPTTMKRYVGGVKYVSAPTSTSYLEGIFQINASRYNTNPGPYRDGVVYTYENGRLVGKMQPYYDLLGDGSYLTDGAPLGYVFNVGGFYTNKSGIGGNLRMADGMSGARDTSKTTAYIVKFDYATQLDKLNYIKAGIQFKYTDHNVNYGQYDVYLPSANTRTVWQKYPILASAYVQDKIELEGMIANIGLRMDFYTANTKWVDIQNPFNKAFAPSAGTMIYDSLTKSTKKIFALSPRLGVAFPITVNSKLFFNYGHFRQLPSPEDLYLIRIPTYTNQVDYLADPNLNMPKTVAYEIGYEQSLSDQFLIRINGYYKDYTEEIRSFTYQNGKGISYSVPTNNGYKDVRGFEFTLKKDRGEWVQGFINYTYQVSTTGRFGLPILYQEPNTQQQYEENYYKNNSHLPQTPKPSPFARLSLDFFTPTKNFGPEVGGIGILTDWRLNITAGWRSGDYITWTGSYGQQIPVENGKIIKENFQWKDSYYANMRFSKGFNFGKIKMQIFADINNVFNFKQMSLYYGFTDTRDRDAYFKSLHLPISEEYSQKYFKYTNIPGNDRPGDYNRSNEFTPIVPVANTDALSIFHPDVIYYIQGQYLQSSTGKPEDLQPVDSAKMKKILDTKSYIDMPNQKWLSFLNPRYIFWGVRLTVDF
ncbi:MAG TPA: carboxypeptidase regulatory-like domain-containing protein [Ignavibacteriales bacterium]|nr:carboxypeptidase regulatory-like domain-containing protein [Ignavibacteriales bacterium]